MAQKSKWDLDFEAGTTTCTYPDGTVNTLNLKRLFPMWDDFNSAQKYWIDYGRQACVDRTAKDKALALTTEERIDLVNERYDLLVDTGEAPKRQGGGGASIVKKYELLSDKSLKELADLQIPGAVKVWKERQVNKPKVITRKANGKK